ncbi:MAG: FAD-dependent thymidylate synthase [Clostridia bacterium]|nr:FAD-dependent thymidylate synthase [Clostridia bacterium]
MDVINAKPGVYIVGVTDKTEVLCAAGGRISTQSGTALEILEKSQNKEKNASLIQKVTKSGHNSTVEHIFFNLAFENVSVVAEQFMIEFRLASFTVKSRRYVDFSDCGYFIPEGLNSVKKEKYRKHMDSLFALYSSLCESGIEKEDARFVLPYCFRSNFFCSLNGRELLLVIKRMLYGSMSKIKEIKDLGIQLLEQGRAIAPGIFAEFEQRVPALYDKAAVSLRLPEKKTEKSAKPDCELLCCTPDPAKAIAQSWLIGEGIYENIEEIAADKENAAAIIKAAVHTARPRCLEAATFTFRINNVSLACITHFARHRVQSIIIPPLYTADRANHIIPPAVAEDEKILAGYCAAFTSTKLLYDELKADGVSEEDLVYCLLSGNTLDITTTVNARELLLFFRLRTCNRAQWEIRNFANGMLALLREKYPEIFNFYGPSCYSEGKCPEGRLSCGKAAQMVERFAENK